MMVYTDSEVVPECSKQVQTMEGEEIGIANKELKVLSLPAIPQDEGKESPKDVTASSDDAESRGGKVISKTIMFLLAFGMSSTYFLAVSLTFGTANESLIDDRPHQLALSRS
jgi:hypothetical protein